MIKIEFIEAQQLLLDSFKLGKKLYDAGFIPTHAISLWRGGTPVGLGVDNFFRLKGHFITHTTVATASYSGLNSQDEIIIKGLEHLIERISREDKLLIIDDIYDSGETIDALINTIKKMARANTPETIVVACVYNKIRSRRVSLPITAVTDKENHWISFPHEISDLHFPDDPQENKLKEKSQKLFDILHETDKFPCTEKTQSNDVPFITPSTLLEDALKLGANIYHDGFIPDFIIAIWKNGICTAIPIHEYYKYQLKISGNKHKVPDHIAINTDISPASFKSNVIGISYLEENINADDKILLIDTVFHTGRLVNQTIEKLKQTLRRNLTIENIRVAALYYNPKSDITQTEQPYYNKPHYYLHKINQSIILPHEIHKLPHPKKWLDENWEELSDVIFAE
jgi:hypoxanthine phosphoribosyltransferase